MTASDSTTLHSVYRIVNFQTGQVYIGQSVHPHARIRQHFYELRKGIHTNQHLQRSYNKYGRPAFYFEIIETNIPESKVDEREFYWIEHYDSLKKGYNRTADGRKGRTFGVSCTWNGIEYPSISHAARANNVHYVTMKIRVERGLTCDEEVMRIKRECEWNGKKYPSIQAAALENGLDYHAMRRRIVNGYSSENDVSHSKKGKPCEWDGVLYPSVYAAAKANNVSIYTMKKLLRNRTRNEST